MSGNVWEWTSSQMRNYPYTPNDGRERLDGGADARRVLRGGSFYDNGWLVRCAARDGINPYSQFRYFGFRVVFTDANLSAVYRTPIRVRQVEGQLVILTA